MKRSEINKAIENAIQMVEKYQFNLPDFASWNKEDWQNKGSEVDEIVETMLGWDVTDFNGGDFDNLGLTAFTIRNGKQGSDKYIKPYAEKLLFSREGQLTPMHFHTYKMEDIINRAGGVLVLRAYNATQDEELDKVNDVVVSIDGIRHAFKPGAMIELLPGQSITLTQRLYHEFWAKKGFGDVMIGEVSMCNDDNADNRFYESRPRFSEIDEDVEAVKLLCNEYPRS